MNNVAVSWCFGKEVAALFMSSVQMMLNHDLANSRHIRSVITEHAHVNITNTRNNIIRRFMQDEKAEWLLMLDTDMMVPPDLVDILLARAVPDRYSKDYTPFIGGLCFTINGDGDIHPTIFKWAPPGSESAISVVYDYPEDELIDVDATGAACLLMHKQALVDMYEVYGDDIFPWFKEYEHAGTALSEDFGFCLRAENLGFKIKVDTAAKVGHFKPFVLDEYMFKKQQKNS